YILFGRKGMKPGEAIEIVADKNPEIPANTQILTFQEELNGYFTSGRIISHRIGPASDWISFFNEIQQRDVFNPDLSSFDVIGISRQGEAVTLCENIQDTRLALESINTDTYPYLKLQYALDDPESSVPEQLHKWQVSYTGVPEGVLIFKDKHVNLQLEEGEEAEVRFEFTNISKLDFPDSLTVEWTLRDRKSVV